MESDDVISQEAYRNKNVSTALGGVRCTYVHPLDPPLVLTHLVTSSLCATDGLNYRWFY